MEREPEFLLLTSTRLADDNQQNLKAAHSQEELQLITMGVKYMGWIHQVEVLAKRRLTDHEILRLYDWLLLVGIEK